MYILGLYIQLYSPFLIEQKNDRKILARMLYKDMH